MSFNLQALKDELTNDPQLIGYLNLIKKANDGAIADLLNSLTGPGIGQILRNDIKTSEVINVIQAQDFPNLTQLQISKLLLLLQGGIFDATNANAFKIFYELFSGMDATISAIKQLALRTGSRAEVLFGTGTIITPDQVGAVR